MESATSILDLALGSGWGDRGPLLLHLDVQIVSFQGLCG